MWLCTSPCQEGQGGGVGLCSRNRDRRRGNGLRLGQGRLRGDSSSNFPMERELRDCKCPGRFAVPIPAGGTWRWHSG